MSIDTILIGNANTYSLVDFRDAVTGALESDVVAFASLCEPPPANGAWLVEGASAVSPIEITSTAHGLSDGDTITIINVGDQRGAHGTFVVAVVDANHFTLTGSTSVAAWTEGGQFYRCIQDCAGLPFSLTGSGQYSLTIEGNVGLIAKQQYMFVVYCTGAYRDLYNEVDRVTAQVRGS